MITSTANQHIKNLIALQKKGKARDEQDAFVVEGIKMYQEAPAERIVRTYVSAGFYQKEENKRLLGNRRAEIVDDRAFAAASDTKTPQGILCVVKKRHYDLREILAARQPLFLVLENIQDPGNLGTMIRTAEGAGVNGIIMTTDTVDIYNPKTIRSTMGSLYRMPFCCTDCVGEVLGEMKELGITSYAAHLKGVNRYYEEDYSRGSAFLIGNEGNGLSDALSAQADRYIRIPMSGKVESLNAAIAASVLMYEAKRQRDM